MKKITLRTYIDYLFLADMGMLAAPMSPIVVRVEGGWWMGDEICWYCEMAAGDAAAGVAA